MKRGRVHCNRDVWETIMGYATPEECVGAYAQLCVALGPLARLKKHPVLFLRHVKVMAFFTHKDRLKFSLVCLAFLRGAGRLKRRANFESTLVLDRLEAATIRFPALEDVNISLSTQIDAPILVKMCTFTCVTSLILISIDIPVLPDEIGALTNLKHLSVYGNKIATLPDSIGRLTALNILYLGENILTAVPASIGYLTAVTKLFLNMNRIAALPDTIGRMTALTELHLNDNWLTHLPDAIGNLTALTSLYLQDNRLPRLPDSIGRLTNLEELDLDGNRLDTDTGLPPSIGSLTALTTLHLGSNALVAVPTSIASLTGLTTLDLGVNCIRDVPSWIEGFTALTRLFLGSNDIAHLPMEIGALTGLEELHIERNQLTLPCGLPESIVNLTELKALDLDDMASPSSDPIQNWLHALESGSCNYPYDSSDDSSDDFENLLGVGVQRW